MSDETKLRPLGDGVLVRVSRAGEVSKGGTVIPEAAQKRPRRGEVLAVGPGVWERDGAMSYRRESDARVGQVVLFGDFAGVEVGDGLLLLRESDLLAVEEPLRASGLGAHPTGGAAAGWACARCDVHGVGEASWIQHIGGAHPASVNPALIAPPG